MNADATTIQVYLGIPMPSMEWFEAVGEDKSRRVLYAVLDELCACSKKLEFRLGNISVTPEITLLDKASTNAIIKRKVLSKKQLKRCEVLLVSCVVPVTNCEQPADLANSKLNAQGLDRYIAREEFCKRLSDLLVMANVARVGSIELSHSAILQDDQKIKYSSLPRMDALSLQRAAEASQSMGWPQLQSLDIQSVWSWAENHRDMLEGFDGTAMGRALCAFSRLFEHKTADEPMQLLWALIGLEALYSKGTADILQQVREKSQALLGRQQDFKKRINDMYKVRSSFVHGTLDFPGLYLFRDADEAVGEYDTNLNSAIPVAVAVLIATIQEVIRRNWSGLDFQYTVGDVSPSTT